MINFSQSENLPLKREEVERLWQATIARRKFRDDQVNIKCVSLAEVRTLNKDYRHKDAPTNVLTFSYATEHDIALCLEVAQAEAQQRGAALRDYVALLLTHAFLHATGLDHERSEAEAVQTQLDEKAILQEAGFEQVSLID